MTLADTDRKIISMIPQELKAITQDPLIISADYRLSKPDYLNDHIWQVYPDSRIVQGLVLETTYGTRANCLRFFPIFKVSGSEISNPDSFHKKPMLNKFYPNYLELIYFPFQDLEVRSEYWVPGSQSISGKFHLINQSNRKLKVEFEWVGILQSARDDNPMTTVKRDHTYCFEGRFDQLSPVCFLNHGPVPGKGSFPSLACAMDLEPRETCTLSWANVTLSDPDHSYEKARKLVNSKWEAEISRIERVNQSNHIEVFTGNDLWDQLIALSQINVNRLVFPGNEKLPNSTCVLTREPDQGYSYSGDGSDYPISWSGQSVLDIYVLSSMIPSINIHLLQGMVENLLYVQHPNGFIDFRPGLAGQRVNLLSTPVLSTLCLKIYQTTNNRDWLISILPQLVNFLNCWLDRSHDKDDDGIPEWQNLIQTGMDSHPYLDPWDLESESIDLQYLESPALISFLIRECKSLLEIFRILDENDQTNHFNKKLDDLENSLKEFWSGNNNIFHYRDYKHHAATSGAYQSQFSGSGPHNLNLKFSKPERIQLSILNLHQNPVSLDLLISGKDENGNPLHEKVTTREIKWIPVKASYTSRNLFSVIDQVKMDGTDPSAELKISTIDFTLEDISLFLPLWSGSVPSNHTDAMIHKKLVKNFLGPSGLADFPLNSKRKSPGVIQMSPLWNVLLIEALLDCGCRDLAATIVENIFESYSQDGDSIIARTDRQAHPMSPFSWSTSIQPFIPINLFLRILGIEKLTGKEIVMDHFSPFPNPISINYLGNTLIINKEEAKFQSATGESVRISGQGPHQIIMD